MNKTSNKKYYFISYVVRQKLDRDYDFTNRVSTIHPLIWITNQSTRYVNEVYSLINWKEITKSEFVKVAGIIPVTDELKKYDNKKHKWICVWKEEQVHE